MFKVAAFRTWSPSRLTGIALLAALAVVSQLMTPLLLAAAVTAVLTLVAAWETFVPSRVPAPGV